MQLSTLQAWRQVYLAEAALVAGAHLAALGSVGLDEYEARVPLSLGHGTLLLGSLLWAMHDVAHRRWKSLMGDVFAVAGCVAGFGLALRPDDPDQHRVRRVLPALTSLVAVAGTIRSSAFPEVD